MSTTYDAASLIEKLKKLEALKRRAGTPAEAAAALERQNNLINRARIAGVQTSLEHIATEYDRAVELGNDPIAKYVQETYNYGKSNNWKRNLFWGLADINFVEAVLITVKRTKRGTKYQPNGEAFKMIGTKGNIEILIYQFEFLAKLIEEMCDTAFNNAKAAGSIDTQWIHPKAWRAAWYMGAIDEIRRRLREQREEMLNPKPKQNGATRDANGTVWKPVPGLEGQADILSGKGEVTLDFDPTQRAREEGYLDDADMKDLSDAEQEQMRALVPRWEEERKQAKEKFWGTEKFTPLKQKRDVQSHEAYNRGRQDGKRVPLRQGIGDNSDRLLEAGR